MKIEKIATFCLAALGVLFLAKAACSYLGGQQPSKNMGSYRSFSFYSDLAGNAATAWMQPGNTPANPWDEFWFDPSGNFNVPGGAIVPGSLAVGSNKLTANTLAQLTAAANFAGTVELTAPVTLTAPLALNCGLYIDPGCAITTPMASNPSGVVETATNYVPWGQ
ncbi:MAG: hypothetical protein ACP5IL_10045, partial [Syntrophobacteraceae bacterium]